MAKRKKRKKDYLYNYGIFGVLLFTALTVGMAFVENVKAFVPLLGTEAGSYTGFQIMFGAKDDLTRTVQVLNFSIGALFAYVLPLAGFILALIANKGSMLINGIALLLFIAGAVLLFLMPDFVVVASEFTALDFSLSVGAIIAGISSILAAIILAAKTFIR